MKIGWLEIELRSELTSTMGDTFDGPVDIDIAHMSGLPIIPAKRLKGALLEAGKELVDWGILKLEHLHALFGKPGLGDSSPLQIFDAILYQIPDGLSEKIMIENISDLPLLLRVNGWNEQEVLEWFTDQYTRTSIDERDGGAKDGHLRTVRAVNPDIVLRSRIELSEFSNAKELEETLRMCVKGLRHLGLANTRGSGEVRCRLTEFKQVPEVMIRKSTENFFRDIGDGRVEVSFHLELEQPVIAAGSRGFADRSEEWISGSALLGAFAGLYIREYGSGQSAHEDEQFSRIFLRDGINFGYALPMVEGLVYSPSPAAWQQEKHSNYGFDLTRASPLQQVLRNLDGMVHADYSSNNVYRYKVRKQVRMHHSRAKNRAIGRSLGAEPTLDELQFQEPLEQNPSDRGQLYQYESLESGQRFSGVMRGKPEDVRLLLELVASNGNSLRLGRSRTAEYGNVRFTPSPYRCPPLLSGEPEEHPTRLIAVMLVAPMLLLDEFGRPDPDPVWLKQQMEDKLGCNIQLVETWLRYTTLSGYNTRWRLPKPQRPALDAGSTMIMKLSSPVNSVELESIFWGWDTGEGNGQIRVMPLDHKNQTSVQFSVIETEAGERNRIASHHPLLRWLEERRQNKKAMAEQQAAGADCAARIAYEELQGVGLVKIQQMKICVDSLTVGRIINQSGYESLCKLVKQIKKEEIREKCEKLIEHCRGKDYSFIRSYLRVLELRARDKA